MITLIAYITMLIDHMWLFIFHNNEIMRSIWRIAFPLFAYGIVRWFKYTKDVEKYSIRILILWIISQLPFTLLLQNNTINIWFTLLFWIFCMIVLDNKKINIPLKILSVSILVLIAEILKFDYWAYWVLTIVFIYLFRQKKILSFYFALLTIMFFCIIEQIYMELYALIWILVINFTKIEKLDFKMNRTFKYLFYPLHLTIIYIIITYLK